MIVIFQSPASGDVIMFGDVAKRMMKLMGKEPTDKGIVTVEQLPDAIARIKAAIEEDKQQRAGRDPEDQPQTEKAEGGGSRPYVSQRAVPLLEPDASAPVPLLEAWDLLEWSLKKLLYFEKPVVWGVQCDVSPSTHRSEPTESATAVRIQLVQGLRRTVLAQIGRGGTDHQLHRKKATCDQSLLRRVTKAKSDIHPILDPVANAIIELNVGLYLWIEPAILVQHRPDDRLQNCSWPDNAQRTRQVFPGLPNRM
jgi:hypothetical protein